MSWLTSWMVDTVTMGRVTVRDSNAQPRAVTPYTLTCRVEKFQTVVITGDNEEKRSEYKIGTEAEIDVDEVMLRDGGNPANVKDYRPVLEVKTARSKNGSRLRLTEFLV